MANPPFDIDETLPEDDDLVSQFPAVCRTFLDVIESWLLTEHDTAGLHKLVTLPTRTSPVGLANALTLWNEAGILYVRKAAGGPDINTVYTIPIHLYSAASPGIPNSSLQKMDGETIKGRVAGAAGVPVDLTGTQATTILDAFTASTATVNGKKGLVPAPVAGESQDDLVLSARGTWGHTGAPHAVIQDRKTNGTDGGTFTSGAQRTRDLGDVLYDPYNIITATSANTFTLGEGLYVIKWSAPACGVGSHQSSLVAAGVIVEQGSSEKAVTNCQTRSEGIARRLLAGPVVYSIQHRCTTTVATIGLGAAASFAEELYTNVEIWKIG